MVNQEDIVSVLKHDQFTTLGFDTPGLLVLNDRLRQAALFGYNPKGATVNDFDWVVIGLRPDSYGTGFDPRLLVYVVFKHKKTGKVAIHADYYLSSWSTAFSLALLA